MFGTQTGSVARRQNQKEGFDEGLDATLPRPDLYQKTAPRTDLHSSVQTKGMAGTMHTLNAGLSRPEVYQHASAQTLTDSAAPHLHADPYEAHNLHGSYEAPPDLVELKLRSDTILYADPETPNPKPQTPNPKPQTPNQVRHDSCTRIVGHPNTSYQPSSS